MELCYYPGCTLKTKAKNLEIPALAAMSALGIELVELPRWNCCGATYALADDDLLHQLAPVRDLIRVKEQGKDELVTICDFCYNTLQRANRLVRNDIDKRNAINSFMEEEPDYDGSVEVLHLLQVLRDKVGWDGVREKVEVSLDGLVIAPYYGCTLLRPQEIAIDDVERPTVLQDLVQALGAKVIPFPFATECCGAFQSVSNPEFAEERAWSILSAATSRGVDMIVTSCPLCSYNLGCFQKGLTRKHSDFKGMAVVYFTQLLAYALGSDPDICHFDLNLGNPQEVLEQKLCVLGGQK
ncbi:MAG: CoB--CoM heterodisulfide reductase iron-sulfur subunit B family protein [Chloroflexota bacterium]|nr:CoB--CoM heterodisulfide reductase iron-sulfur subunit B family protein [Chloroflexota bacterium]